MKINLAKNAGFCGGVQRAFDMVKDNFSKKDHKRVFIWGSLAHNKSVAKTVSSWNIKTVNSFDELEKGDTVIITAHGKDKDFYYQAKKKEIIVFDTTCPKVKKVHLLIEEYSQKGFFVIIFGDKDHKEVKGVHGWAIDGDKVKVVANVEELNNFLQNKESKDFGSKGIVAVSQTTQKKIDYKKVIDSLSIFCKDKKINLEAKDTICIATAQRQPEAVEISRNSDAVIVIGGKDSANTGKLYDIAKEELGSEKVFWTEQFLKDKKDLIVFLSEKSSIGILSGASTPKNDIAQVVEFISKIDFNS